MEPLETAPCLVPMVFIRRPLCYNVSVEVDMEEQEPKIQWWVSGIKQPPITLDEMRVIVNNLGENGYSSKTLDFDMVELTEYFVRKGQWGKGVSE